MRWGQRLAAGIAALVALVGLTACGIGSEPRPQRLPPALVDVSPAATPSPSEGRPVTVYLVDSEGRLRAAQIDGPAGPHVSSALTALLQVGTTLTAPPGLRSLVPRSTSLRRVVVYPSDVLVDLGPEFLGLTGQDQVLATAQVVFTATERRQAARVALSVDGRDIPVPVGDGSLRAEPVTRQHYTTLAPTPAPSPSP
jgi:spore germination protein GerM